MDLSAFACLYRVDSLAGNRQNEKAAGRHTAADVFVFVLVSADRETFYEIFGGECILEDSVVDPAGSYHSLCGMFAP